MASRFLVTGVQLGMIKGMIEAEADNELSKGIVEIIDGILKYQYVGNSTNNIEKDVDDAIASLGFDESCRAHQTILDKH